MHRFQIERLEPAEQISRGCTSSDSDPHDVRETFRLGVVDHPDLHGWCAGVVRDSGVEKGVPDGGIVDFAKDVVRAECGGYLEKRRRIMVIRLRNKDKCDKRLTAQGNVQPQAWNIGRLRTRQA